MIERRESNFAKMEAGKNHFLGSTISDKMTSESDHCETQELNNEEISDSDTRKKVKKQNGLYSPNVFAKKSKLTALEVLTFLKQVVSDPDTL